MTKLQLKERVPISNSSCSSGSSTAPIFPFCPICCLGIPRRISKMHELSFIVGIVGNITSVLVFASPIKTFWRVVRRGSTEEFDSLPYVCTLLSSSLWAYYGLLKGSDGLLITTVNSVGAVLELTYVGLFLTYAPRRAKMKTLILALILDVGFLGGTISVTSLVLHESLRLTVIGFFCVGLSMFFYGSPLVVMRTVISTKSVEYMPFLLSLFLFLNGAVWTFWSFLEKDYFVGIPNGIGFILGTAQLLLYAMYVNGDGKKGQHGNLSDAAEPFVQTPEAREDDIEKAYEIRKI